MDNLLCDVSVNDHGDKLFTMKQEGCYSPPPHICDMENDCAIFKGYSKPIKNSYFLCNSTKYGILYATKKMVDIFPSLENEQLCAANMVIFINKKYVILVQLHESQLFNPGGSKMPDETFKECAIREAKEETGLDVNNVKCFARWSVDYMEFGGLLWNKKSIGFYGEATLPENWPKLDNRSYIVTPPVYSKKT